MKKIFLAIIIFSLFSIEKSSAQDNPITLKFNLPKGSSYDYNMDINMNMKGEAGGQAVSVENKMGMGYHFTTLDDSAGWKKISTTVSGIAMHINTGGVNIDYDSDQPVDTSNVVNSTMGKVLGAMKGAQFTFIMNDQGKIGYVSGIKEMADKMVAAAPGNGGMASGMSNAFNEDNFKQNIQQAFGAYPDKPVKPGDTWTNTMNTNNNGVALKIDNTYTLESVSGNNANVKVNAQISSANSNMPITGTMAGTMQYDIPSGVVVDGALEMSMNMSMGGDQSTPMVMNIKTKITGKKS